MNAFARSLGSLTARTRLWLAFVVVHLVLCALNLWGPGLPLGDVTETYVAWARNAQLGLGRMGIDQAWVYPILAFVPMAMSLYVPFLSYGQAWLLIVSVLNAAGFWLLLGRGVLTRSRCAAAKWWLVFLILLGPIALGRIDAVTVPFAIAGLLWALGRPRLSSALLTVGAWIKVWPAAVLAGLFITSRRRWHVLWVAMTISALVSAASLAAGAGWNTFGFVAQQAGRGLQVESLGAIPFLWAIVLGSADHAVVYNRDILTFEVIGPGTGWVASLLTPLMLAAVVIVAGLGLLATWRGARTARVLPELALGLTMALIVTNKVGSPQYISWLAPVVIYGIVIARSRFGVPAGLALAIAAITQVIYPYLYPYLLDAAWWQVIFITIRAVLEIWVVVWVARSLWSAARTPQPLMTRGGPGVR